MIAPDIRWDFNRRFTAGAGNDNITGGNGADVIDGGPGIDTIRSGIDDDALFDDAFDPITGTYGGTIDAGHGFDLLETIGRLVEIRDQNGNIVWSRDPYYEIGDSAIAASPADQLRLFFDGPQAGWLNVTKVEVIDGMPLVGNGIAVSRLVEGIEPRTGAEAGTATVWSGSPNRSITIS